VDIHGKQDQGDTAEGRDAGEGGSRDPPGSPLLDLSDAAVKKLIRSAKKRGYVTHDQINALLSSEEVKSEQIEDILAKFSEKLAKVRTSSMTK
jgi:RNA polymerase primary sigma factor